MTPDRFEQMIEQQTELIAALDASDPDAILVASGALAQLLNIVRADNGGGNQKHLEQALKLADAARIRVNYLTAWNRQKLDRLAQLRGQSVGTIYAKPRTLGM